jgi:pyruvate dehydrogenase E1 component alpha subunit
MSDPATYRTRDEVEQEKRHDPLEVVLQRMRDAGQEPSAQELERLEAEIGEEVRDAVRFADESPDPGPETIWEDVYADPDDPAMIRDDP